MLPYFIILHCLHCVVLIVGICLGIKEQSVPGTKATIRLASSDLKLLLFGETDSHRSALYVLIQQHYRYSKICIS